MKSKLPRLNSSVYIITYVDGKPFSISKDRVYMKNTKSFITNDMMSNIIIDEYKRPCNVNDYGYSWTSTLQEAKDVVKKYAEDNHLKCFIVKDTDVSWNVGVW